MKRLIAVVGEEEVYDLPGNVRNLARFIVEFGERGDILVCEREGHAFVLNTIGMFLDKVKDAKTYTAIIRPLVRMQTSKGRRIRPAQYDRIE